MRRAVVAGAAATLVCLAATACSGVHPSAMVGGSSRVRVDTPSLVTFKAKHTQVPDCPRVSSAAVAGGLPSVTVPCLGGGRSVDLAGLRGPLIVNFWQSTCHPCRQEMPALAAYARAQSAVKVLGVDILDVQPAAALLLARDSGVGYPLVADPAGNLVGRKPVPRTAGLPFTIYVDASGRVVHLEEGAMTSERAVAANAAKYLGARG